MNLSAFRFYLQVKGIDSLEEKRNRVGWVRGGEGDGYNCNKVEPFHSSVLERLF